MFDQIVGSYSPFDKLAEITGIQVDQITFISTQLLALSIAPAFRSLLHPSKTSPQVRHAVCLILGVLFGWLCFGWQLLHIFGLSSLTYVLLKTVSPLKVQGVVLTVNLVYLSGMHLYRLFYDYASYTLDITGPLMVTVQKLTSLAFILHDSVNSKKDDSVVKFTITSVPSVLEFYGYVFNFQTIMVGPLVFFNDYMEWVNGDNFSKCEQTAGNSTHNGKTPSPLISVLKKLAASALCGIVYILLVPHFPISKLREVDFLERWPTVNKLIYLYFSTGIVRCMYYHAWLLTDAVSNASGLGFNGFDENGVAQWDLLSNVDIIKFEFGENLKASIDSWNKGTNKWLRLIVYSRVKKFSTPLTFALSALWHGFYPGYYLTFSTGALFISAARTIRRKVRPLFMANPSQKLFYDVMTIITTRVALAYMVFPFVVLELWLSLRIYFHMLWWMHALAVAAILVLPYVPTKQQRETFSAHLTQSGNNLVTTSIHG